MLSILNITHPRVFLHSAFSCLRRNLITLFYLALLLATNNTSAQDEQMLEIFLPISSISMDLLHSELTAALRENDLLNVSIHFADHWHDYQQSLKTGQLGIYFAPPHFTAWAIEQHQFKPLLRLAEPLSYVIATKRIEAEFFEINDLIGHRICTHIPLNLDYLLAVQVFEGDRGQITTQFVPTVSTEMRAEQSSCNAYTVSNHVLQRLVLEGSDDYIRLYQSKTYNNYALISHPALDSVLLEQVQAFFLQARTQQILRPLFKLYANDVRLISSYKEDYPSEYIGALTNYWRIEPSL